MPRPGAEEALIAVKACGVCRTDLHVVDGELHRSEAAARAGPRDHRHGASRRAPASTHVKPATGSACRGSAGCAGVCDYCRSGPRESVRSARASPAIRSTAAMPSFAAADARFCFAVPAAFGDVEAAPLMCAGLDRLSRAEAGGRPAERLGIIGLRRRRAHRRAGGALSAASGSYAFTKPGDRAGQEFARSLGAVWAGGSDELPPEPLDARARSSRRSARSCRRRSPPRRRAASSSAPAST